MFVCVCVCVCVFCREKKVTQVWINIGVSDFYFLFKFLITEFQIEKYI